MGCANTADAVGRCGRNVYEVNPRLWQVGRGKPRLDDMTVEETALKKDARGEEQVKRAVETCRRRNLSSLYCLPCMGAVQCCS